MSFASIPSGTSHCQHKCDPFLYQTFGFKGPGTLKCTKPELGSTTVPELSISLRDLF